ncbi:MAG: MFS transporter [Roseiflexaceae bacterium]
MLLATLRQRNFALLWSGGLISMLGDWALIAAMPFYIYQQTGSALASGGLLMAYAAPAVLFGSVTGVFVDRWDRQQIMVVVNLVRAVLMLTLFLVPVFGWIWAIYVVAALEAMLGLFFQPAEAALLPRLVGDEHVLTANALNALNDNLARLAGPALGALLVALFGLPGVIVADSLSYILSGLLIAGIDAPSKPHTPPGTESLQQGTASIRSVWSDWTAGLHLVRRQQVVSVLFVTLGVAAVADGFNSALLVPFVQRVLGGATREFAWLLTAQAVSGMGAGLLLPRASRVVAPAVLVGLSAGFAALLFLIAYTFPSLPLVLGLAMLLGVPSVGFYTGTRTLLQQHVADQYRGRVFGALGTTNALLQIGALGLAGTLADRVGVAPMLYVVVALWFLTAGVALARLPAAARIAADSRVPQ